MFCHYSDAIYISLQAISCVSANLLVYVFVFLYMKAKEGVCVCMCVCVQVRVCAQVRVVTFAMAYFVCESTFCFLVV